MATIGHILVFSLIGGVISLIGGALLISKKSTADKLARYATPFAGGALLAAVFLDLIKEGIEFGEASTVLYAALFGILFFFLLEGVFHGFHHHHEHPQQNNRSRNAWLIVIGDTLHNALDGAAIAASFLVSVPTGIVTTIAVAAHEIPQEIGDFGLLLSKGMSRKKVLIVNIVSALSTVVMALITFSLGSDERLPIGVLLGLSAGFLLYIAMSDVIPAIHEQYTNKKQFRIQAALLIIGAVAVGLIIQITHTYIDAGHEHTDAGESSMTEDTHADGNEAHDEEEEAHTD